MKNKDYERLCRRYEQLQHLPVHEHVSYMRMIQALYKMLRSTYWTEFMPTFPTPDDYKKYEEYCEYLQDIFGLD